MSTIDSTKMNKDEQSLAEHLAFAAEAVQSWPEWQRGLLQASAQPKLTTPRTSKAGVKNRSDQGSK